VCGSVKGTHTLHCGRVKGTRALLFCAVSLKMLCVCALNYFVSEEEYCIKPYKMNVSKSAGETGVKLKWVVMVMGFFWLSLTQASPAVLEILMTLRRT